MKSIRNLTPTVIYSLMGLMCAAGTAHATMQPLDDSSMSQTTGQSAFFTDYVAPGATLQGVSAPAVDSGMGFFTLGLQGTVSLNANINRLQLGCGGVNGVGCDIDLSQVRLSGTTPGPSGTYADSDAVLTNPFIQLAIANPTTLATRHVVGLNLGSQLASGLLSIGMNPDPSTAGTPGGTTGGETGINTISGSFLANVTNLSSPLHVCLASANGSHTGCGFLSFEVASGTATISGGTYSTYISGKRLTGSALGPIPLTANIYGLNISVNAVVNENLIDVHNLQAISTSLAGLSLSLNSQPISWPQIGSSGTYSWSTNSQTTSQTGWWLNLPQLNIDLAGHQTQDIYVGTGEALGGAIGIPLTLGSINLGQVPLQNCYGTLKFC